MNHSQNMNRVLKELGIKYCGEIFLHN